MQILKPTQHRPSEQGSAEWFTGTVWLDELAVTGKPSGLLAHTVTFEPGARTAWHTHPVGQVLHALGGLGWVQKAGEEKRSLQPGDTVLIEPGEKHWHGAASDRLFVHLAVQETATDGSEAEFFEHVTDTEYGAGKEA